MPKTLLFGALSDVAGWTSRDLDAGTLDELISALEVEDARLGEQLRRPSTLVIVNNTSVPASLRQGDRPLGPEDEIAFGSPVSGG